MNLDCHSHALTLLSIKGKGGLHASMQKLSSERNAPLVTFRLCIKAVISHVWLLMKALQRPQLVEGHMQTQQTAIGIMVQGEYLLIWQRIAGSCPARRLRIYL